MADITNFAYKGRGRIWVGDLESLALREFGNCSSAEMAFTVEEQTLKDFRTCAGGNYASGIDISDGSLSLVIHDLSPENFALAFYGDTSAVVEAAATEEVHTVPTVTNRMISAANAIKTSGTITVSSATSGGGTVYTGGGDDYTVHPGGIEYHLGGTGSLAGSETVYVNYTKRAATRIEALMSASVSKYLQIDGLNCAQSGAPVVVRVWSFSPSPTDAFQLISEEFASFTLNGKMVADTSKGASESQYFQADVAITTT